MHIYMTDGWETGNYDPDTCRNGGGYWQYSGWALFANGVAVEYQDTSCGDFGAREYAQFHMPDGWLYSIGVGSMDDASIDNEDAEQVATSMMGRYGLDMYELLRDAASAIEDVAEYPNTPN